MVTSTPDSTEHARDEHTIFKFYDALREDVGLTEKQVRAAIVALKNRGLVVFEKLEAELKELGTVYRGVQDADVPVSPAAPAVPEAPAS